MRDKQLAVIIGFRDWGIDRLSVAIRRLANSTIAEQLDIVVSDYGSLDEAEVRSAVEAAGGRVVRTDREGPWSRSRALNAGVWGSSAPYVITTDSDIIFTSQAAENLVRLLDADSNTAHLVQCRDLNENYGVEQAAAAGQAELEANSCFRPRWGMGGLIAFRREHFDRIRGYDARMEIYGGEDTDFAQRLTRIGVRLNWVDDTETRIYHIWHPVTREAVARDPVQLSAQQANRDIVLNDRSWVRNLNVGTHARPVASVLIATRNRAKYLGDSLNSVLAQSVDDIEILVMDDGSDDETPDVLASFDDPRLRCFRQEGSGVATARNRLVDETRSEFVVVQDDDDIMLPWRIEAHLEAMAAGIAATYGGWVDFDDRTGETLAVQGRDYDAAAFMYAGKVLAHGTSMFRTEVLKRYRYREFLKAGVDFNLIARLSQGGFQFRHTHHLHILRRMHDMNLTRTALGDQRSAATRTTSILRKANSATREKSLREVAQNMPTIRCRRVTPGLEEIRVYLPDHLCKRSVTISNIPEGGVGRLLKLFDGAERRTPPGWSDENRLTLVGLKLSDLALLRRFGGLEVRVDTASEDDAGPEAAATSQMLLQALPGSGLLDEETIHLVTIGDGGRAGAPGGEGIRSRTWSDGLTQRPVHSRRASTLNEAIEIVAAQPDASTYLFLPKTVLKAGGRA